jgi:hypothetical protein
MTCAALLACIMPGCGGDGSDSPNSPQPADAGPEFVQKTADMMKQANAGMDLKKAQQTKAAESKK